MSVIFSLGMCCGVSVDEGEATRIFHCGSCARTTINGDGWPMFLENLDLRSDEVRVTFLVEGDLVHTSRVFFR